MSEIEQAEALAADFEQDGSGEPGMAPFGKVTVRYAAAVLRSLIAELNRMRPVVEAALDMENDPRVEAALCVEDVITGPLAVLLDAIDTYRASERIKS